MKIVIEYESSWRNSFLDGSNNEPMPKNGRKFIGSMTNLKKKENFLTRQVTKDTVMGILNRLIGDQRKLYQSRQDSNYYFANLEDCISFEDKPEEINTERVYIRNITGSTDQNSYTGMIKTNDPMLKSDYSEEFWGVLGFNIEDLVRFILHDKKVDTRIELDPLSISGRFEEINKLKPIEVQGDIKKTFELLSKKFPKFKSVNKKGLGLPIGMYCSALYLQVERLTPHYNMESALTKSGSISGISSNGFTKKDFMNRFTTGDKKRIWGNPYIMEEMIKGEGKTQSFLTKVNGKLDISIAIDKTKADELSTMIDNAGVSSFYLGKKGLAYVVKIRP